MAQNANFNSDQNLFVCICVCVYLCVHAYEETEQNREDWDNLETETLLAPSIVGNKLIPTSWEPMGVGETPSLFPGKQSSFSSLSPLPLSLSLC